MGDLARHRARNVWYLAYVGLHMKRYLVGSIAATTLTFAASPAAAATLVGPAQLRVLQKLTYRATGLPPGDYALIIERHPRRARCIAHLAAQRHAAGTERFYGSLPDTLNCVRGSRHFTTPMHPGAYRVLVRGDRSDDHTGASRPVRVIK
jgi:hypothetical protein